VWRIGFTSFAVRMLGEPVEIDFEVDAGSSIETGQVIGWLEGFKAVTDLYAPIGGRFVGANPLLEHEVERIQSDCYERGWLYEVEAAGDEGGDLFDADGYARLLDGTIDRMAGDHT
jgi:glycine cleavage system H protein